ncbi:MAG: hypothetical protein GOVbin655_43 [Prokaryotic dsDNA virus sp.]|nr:MAG: hypothetical protein GOVbin655_43 [Prokaryotic dsDNA virus sp.]|tara:strand:- start:2607 stop:2768 length:162 start_codon:yes stop_codon:yes gene_type:complete
MRLTEYFHFITRTDLKLGRREKDTDYTHFVPWTKHKRERYLYQCKLKGKKPTE